MDIIVPELGEDIKTATIACWHFNAGDNIKEGDDIVELVTAKATFNVSSNVNGVLKEVFANKGEDVNIGQKIAVIEKE